MPLAPTAKVVETGTGTQKEKDSKIIKIVPQAEERTPKHTPQDIDQRKDQRKANQPQDGVAHRFALP
jgi:hypothetical protein